MKQKSILLIPIIIGFIACSQKEVQPTKTASTKKSAISTQGTTFSLPQKPPAIDTPSEKERTQNAYKERKLREQIDATSKRDGKLEEKKDKYGNPYHDRNPLNKILDLDIPQF